MARSLASGDITISISESAMLPLADNADNGRDRNDKNNGNNDPKDGWDFGRGP
jgi:hypothetical protein